LFVNVRGKLVFLVIVIYLDLVVGDRGRGTVEVNGIHEWWERGGKGREKCGELTDGRTREGGKLARLVFCIILYSTATGSS